MDDARMILAGRQSAFQEVLTWLDSQPQDFCNDGHYSEKEMVNCLSSVIRINEDRLRVFLNSKI